MRATIRPGRSARSAGMTGEGRSHRPEAAPHRDDERHPTGDADDGDRAGQRVQPGDPPQRQRAPNAGRLVAETSPGHEHDRGDTYEPGPGAGARDEQPASGEQRTDDRPLDQDAHISAEYGEDAERQIWVTEVRAHVVGHPTTLPTW